MGLRDIAKRELIIPDSRQLLLMDGTTSVEDMVHKIQATTTGTAGFDTLLNVSAPKIGTIGGDTFLTSLNFPTADLGLVAGQDLSLVVVTKTPWAGDDAVDHYIVDIGNAAPGPNRIFMNKWNDNKVYFGVADSATAYVYKTIDVNGTNWAADTEHILIGTRTTGKAVNLYLDGTKATAGVDTGTGMESSLGTYTWVGTDNQGAKFLNAPVLVAIFDRVLSNDEISRISNMGAWIPRYKRAT